MDLNKLYYIQQYNKDEWEKKYRKKHYSILDAIADTAKRVSQSSGKPDNFTVLMSPGQMEAYRKAFGGSNKTKVRKRSR